MIRTVLAVAAAATCVLALAAPASAAELPPLDPQRLSGAIANLPSGEATGALVQVRGPAGSWQGTSGIADLRTGAAIVPDSRFRIGSMTKTFTAAVALQLVAEHKLDLGQTVRHYLPEFLPESLPADYGRITVRNVLQYTSGIQQRDDVRPKDPDWFFAHRYDTFPHGSQLDLARDLAFEPGTYQRYGNGDYILAGLLIEKVTGHTWEDEVTRRIIRPLRLTGTSAPVAEIGICGPHAHGYQAVGDAEYADVTDSNPSLQWSAAAVISTAPDLDRFLVALFSGRVVPREQFALMLTPPGVDTYETGQPGPYTAGLTVFQVDGTVLYGKSGDRPGYLSGMATTADLSRRLVYSVNTVKMGSTEQQPITLRIAAAVYQNPGPR
ncbi:MAG: D-alanyl-D-alanine carboxypeptidase [Cryptosporangiaceae bacterium]|nr:D-alanyl-D-alanine carboxypeptidase [Cryptosporangiaceae bacterium]